MNPNQPDWEAWNSGGGPSYPHEKVVQFCFRHYPKADRVQTRALDLGCGSGVHTAFLAREGFITSASDIAEQGVANTRQRLGAEQLVARLRVESADQSSFDAASFDLIICVGVLECVGPGTATAVIRRARHMLSAGGRGLFLFCGEGDFRLSGENRYQLHGFSRDEVEAVFADQFSECFIDEYSTTYEGGRQRQRDWLVTVTR